jgi:hypothetical protein
LWWRQQPEWQGSLNVSWVLGMISSFQCGVGIRRNGGPGGYRGSGCESHIPEREAQWGSAVESMFNGRGPPGSPNISRSQPGGKSLQVRPSPPDRSCIPAPRLLRLPSPLARHARFARLPYPQAACPYASTTCLWIHGASRLSGPGAGKSVRRTRLEPAARFPGRGQLEISPPPPFRSGSESNQMPTECSMHDLKRAQRRDGLWNISAAMVMISLI